MLRQTPFLHTNRAAPCYRVPCINYVKRTYELRNLLPLVGMEPLLLATESFNEVIHVHLLAGMEPLLFAEILF
jgi:hypothetical protein